MRWPLALLFLCLAACASDKLSLTPPAGIDLSGRWKLNEADSDDPRRLAQQRDPSVVPNQTNGGSGGGSGGRGGRGGRGGQMPTQYGAAGPAMPSMALLGDALRWPGKQLEIKQVAGVVAFVSDGYDRVCQPSTGGRKHHHPHTDQDRDDRDAPDRGRDMAPPRCGWAEKSLLVQGGESDDEQPPFEEYYDLSDDKQRLIETVSFRGGRSAGYSMSRVWDRVTPGT